MNKSLLIVALVPLLLVPLVNAQLSEKEQADKEKAIADQNLTKLCHEERNSIGNMTTSDPLFQMSMDTYKTSDCEPRTGVLPSK
jgi:hypothetical protein